jgi:hypothetical protein
MKKAQMAQLLAYWHKRQANSTVPIAFRFKAYKDRSTGEMIKANGKGKRKEKASSKGKSRPQRKSGPAPKGRQVPKDNSDGEEIPLPSDSEEDEDEDEDSMDHLESEGDSEKAGPSDRNRVRNARREKMQAAKEKALEVTRQWELKKKGNVDQEDVEDDTVQSRKPQGKKRKTPEEGFIDDEDKEGGRKLTDPKKKIKMVNEGIPRKIQTWSKSVKQEVRDDGEDEGPSKEKGKGKKQITPKKLVTQSRVLAEEKLGERKAGRGKK